MNAVVLVDAIKMEPLEFLQEWDITREEMAELLDVSIDSVNSWLAGRRSPQGSIKRLLAEIHHRWDRYYQDEQDNSPTRQLYIRRPRKRPKPED
ncbi:MULTISPECIES: helix-turn-helix domain-containing protein [Aerosakkonema]|uniref:helix-turn-helix domain-containing protein n=1 Tax=Aerosakkonema TaxID=1246629 RepID=UPI0035B9709B